MFHLVNVAIPICNTLEAMINFTVLFTIYVSKCFSFDYQRYLTNKFLLAKLQRTLFHGKHRGVLPPQSLLERQVDPEN